MKVYIADFNGVLTELKDNVNLVTNWRDADTLVIWQDVVGDGPTIAQEAHSLGKRVLVAEHGLLSINDYIPPLSKPLIGDKYLTWGQRTKDWLIEKAHIHPDRIFVTGTLLQNNIIPLKPHKTKRILFAPRHWGKEIPENIQVANELKKLDVFVYTKIVEGEHDPNNYENPIQTNRVVENHIKECFKAISEADIVVGIGEGTFAALTYMMGLPYVSVDNWIAKNLLGKLYTREVFNEQISNACVQTPVSKLNGTIMYELEHDTKKKERKEFLKYALNIPGKPLDRFLEVINEK